MIAPGGEARCYFVGRLFALKYKMSPVGRSAPEGRAAKDCDRPANAAGKSWFEGVAPR